MYFFYIKSYFKDQNEILFIINLYFCYLGFRVKPRLSFNFISTNNYAGFKISNTARII